VYLPICATWRGNAGTALEAVLPVELEAQPDSSYFAEVQVEPTRAGGLHPALQFAAEPAASGATWQSLPPLSTFNRVRRLKPGATALLAGSGTGVPNGQVVLAFQRYGRGLSLALPVQDTWIWRMHADIPLDDQTHEIFWRQLLR
jgi:hypothetical protein